MSRADVQAKKKEMKRIKRNERVKTNTKKKILRYNWTGKEVQTQVHVKIMTNSEKLRKRN